MPAPYPPITLTTDFGTFDHYVAQMKGAILRVNAWSTIVDVTHEIAPQDIRRAAFLIDELAPSFPVGTVHVAVIDPGVGSPRAILAVLAGGQYFIAPDNGLLTLVLERHPDAKIVTVPQPPGAGSISPTFHGRDIMAPAAARLTLGTPIDQMGSELERFPTRLDFLTPRVTDTHWHGEVAWIDRFGNVITTLSSATLANVHPDRLRVSVGGLEVTGLKSFYSEMPPGEPLLLIGSSGRLEIAVNRGSAAARLGVSAGDPVIVSMQPPS